MVTPGEPLRRRTITVAAMLAALIQTLDSTIANVALPRMQGAFGATQEQISWVLTSYILASAILMPLTGLLAARLGRRRLFVAAVIGFTVASMLCGAASSLGQMVTARILQGAFGAFLVPLSQSVMLDTWPRERHAAAMAAWGIGVMVGPILGPTLGGWLTEHRDWRWVFYLNLPVGLLTAVLLGFLPETPREPGRRFDALGFAFLAIGLASLQLMLDRGESLDWFASREIVIEAAVAALALYLFVAHVLTHPAPFVDPRLFADRNFGVGLAAGFGIGVVLLATMTLLPPFLSTLLGWPVMDVGLALAPRGAGTMIAMLVVGRIGDRIDPRVLIALGLCLTAASLHAMTGFDANVRPSHIVTTGVVQGLGIGFVFPPLTAVAFASLPQRLRTDGTALFSLVRNLGSSLGISIVVTALARNAQANHAALSGAVDPLAHLPLRMAEEAGAWRLDTLQGLAELQAEVSRQAMTVAYLQDFRLMSWVCLATLPLVLLLRRPPPRSAPPRGAAAD